MDGATEPAETCRVITHKALKEWRRGGGRRGKKKKTSARLQKPRCRQVDVFDRREERKSVR